MKRLFLALTVLALLAGCGRQTGDSSGRGGHSASNANEVTFSTSDNWTIHADYLPVPDPKGAVILLHQRNGSAKDWKPLEGKLNKSGLAALALDLRGAGRSTGTANGDSAPWDVTNDVTAAIEWLKSKGIAINHIGLAGASYGANNALRFAADNPSIKAVALLSPGEDYNGLTVQDAAKKFEGDILVLSAKSDSIAAKGPDAIAHSAAHPPDAHRYDGSAHGTDLFHDHPDSVDTIAAFFSGKL
jgi:dienelactone hydrolase